MPAIIKTDANTFHMVSDSFRNIIPKTEPKRIVPPQTTGIATDALTPFEKTKKYVISANPIATPASIANVTPF